MEYCAKCSHECNSMSVQCFYCKNWYHATCCDISADDLEMWSPSYMRFACRNCAFTDGKYDAGAALVRLTIERLNKRRNGLHNQARSELNLLKTYGIEVPIRQDLSYSSHELDQISVKILALFEPSMNDQYLPMKTVADGNCFYRAVSLSLCGTEEYHVLLRLLTSIELIQNRQSYDTKRKFNDFLNDCRIVTSKYETLVYDALVESAYAEMAHMYALSAALCLPIRSYFPPQLGNELSAAFTRVVQGRGVTTTTTSVHLMWSSVRAPETPQSFEVNHFVPLIRKKNGLHIPVRLPFDIDRSVSDMSDAEMRRVDHLTDKDETDYPKTAVPCSKSDPCIDPVSDRSMESQTETDDSYMNYSERPDPDNELSHMSAEIHMSDTETESHMNYSERSDPDSDRLHISDESHISGNKEQNDKMTNNNQTKVPNDETTGLLHSGFMSVEQAVSLLNKGIPGKQNIPPGLKENVYFMLDNSGNASNREQKKRSNFSDDCGVWDTSKGTSPKTFYLRGENGSFKQIYLRDGKLCSKKQINRKIEYVVLEPQPPSSSVFVVHRYYAQLKADNGYRKKVTWLAEGGVQSKVAVVEYLGKFPGLAPHGNSTKQTEYLRTPHYVMDEIKELTGKKKPHKIYNELTQKYDELTQPTGLRQIHDKQRRERQKEKTVDGHKDNFADQIRHLETLVSENDQFVRSVIHMNGKSPCVVLYTDEQLADIRNLCCTGRTVLGVDKTFMLCKMHVTVTCYRQTTVNKISSGENPIFLGPLYVHDNSDFETYSHFFHHLKVKLLDCSLRNLVIGSDDEKALVKAITLIIPEARHVLCTRHLEENARQILKDDAVTVAQRKDIMHKIFGKEGLISADDSVCFNERCDQLESELSHVSDKFQTYFTKRLKTAIKDKVTDPVRDGKVSKLWTNNNCESMNHVLKQTVDWKSKPLTEFVFMANDLVRAQFRGLRSALVNTGEYRLADSHKQFVKTKTDWTVMTEQQRLNHYRKFRQYVQRETRLVTSSDGKSTLLEPRTNGRKPGQRKRKKNLRTFTRTDKRAKTLTTDT